MTRKANCHSVDFVHFRWYAGTTNHCTLRIQGGPRVKRVVALLLSAVVFVFVWLNVGAVWLGKDGGAALAASRLIQPCDPGLEPDDPFIKPS